MVQVQALEIFPGSRIDISILQAEQILEEIKIGKDRGKELAVMVAIFVIDHFSIQFDLTGFGQVEAADNFRERRFAAAIAPDEEDQFAGLEGQIDWAENKFRILMFHVIRMSDACQLQPFERYLRLGQIDRA